MVGKHKLRINLSEEPADTLVSVRTVSLRERLLAKPRPQAARHRARAGKLSRLRRDRGTSRR